VGARLAAPDVAPARTPDGKLLPIDRLVDHGDTVTLGGTTLTAHLLPGHTPGCLAWSLDLEEGGRTYYGFIECSLNGRFLDYVDYEAYLNFDYDMCTIYRYACEIPDTVFVLFTCGF